MASRHDYAGKPRPTIDLRPPMVLRGFGNSPVPSEMFIPPGTVPPITDVTYAGSYPLRHYITNPPITTPEFPSNPPRATNKAPVRPFEPYDRLTNTRATTAQLGSLRQAASLGALPAGAYSGAVGRVVRALDPNTGAGLRGQIVGARLHGHDAPPSYLHGAHGAYMLGAAPDALELKQGIPQDVPDVARFTIADPRTVKGQIVGSRLVLLGIKEGSTKVEVQSPAGARSEITLTVKGLIPTEQMALATQTFNEIKSLTASPSELKIDWQDADVIRANADLIKSVLQPIRDKVKTFPGYRPQEYQSQFLLNVVDTAKANPNLRTLREVVLKLVPNVESDANFRSRECGRNSVSGVVFHDLYTFTRDYMTFVQITNAVMKVAEIVGKVWSTFDPVTGGAISQEAKAARAVAAPAMAEFGTEPKRLVANFGNAVCVAISGGIAAMPVTLRAAATLRKRAEVAANRVKLLTAAGRLSGLGATPANAAEAKEQAQQALAQLAALDVPGAFTAAENAKLEEARAIVNADTSLAPSTAAAGGVPGWVWGAGAVAVLGVGYLVFRKPGK
jgi:hypothetical protein